MRRFGRPGLLGTIARTAVIAGTAQMTSNALNRRAQVRAQDQAEADLYEQQQLGAAPLPPPPAAANPSAAGASLVDKLAQLSALHEQGALDDAEFQAAKTQLLG